MKIFSTIYLCAYSSTIVILGVAYCCTADQEIWRNTNLKLIIPGHVIKNYGILRPDSDWELMTVKENAKLRKEICEELMKTPYFQKYSLRWIDADLEEMCHYVLDNHPNAGTSIFQKKTYWLWDHYKYDTSYTLRATDMNSGRQNSANFIHVFPCLVERSLFLAGELHSRKMEEYFVSEPFHVSAPEFHVNEIAGRIIFTRYSDKENLRIEAFATDAEKWIRELRVNRSDLKNKYGFQDLKKLANLA